jgi:hypothetical protein
MRKHATLTLPADGNQAKLERGKLDIERGKAMRGLRLKLTIPVANTSGGDGALAAADRETLLDDFQFNVSYGSRGQWKPFAAVKGARIHREARAAYGSEIEGYADTTTGLAQTISNGATDTLVCYLPIPLGAWWWLDQVNHLGMGRSQAATLELEIRRLASAIKTGFAISGSVTAEVIPDLVSAKGDRWSFGPEYLERDETDKTARFPDGLPLRLSERTAVHASSSLTNIDVGIDDEVIHSQVSPAELITEYNDSPLLPAIASLADVETLLYSPAHPVRFVDLPSGSVHVTQNVKNLATALYSLLYLPIPTAEEIATEVEYIATVIRKKTIRAVSLPTVEGWRIPTRLRPYVPFVLFDEDDREFEQFPGLVAEPGRRADITCPSSYLAAAKGAYGAHKAKGENKAASAIIKEVAVAIPGAVQSGRGFRRNRSDILLRVEGFFR